jgi:HK97 family phage major capsid protein
MDLASEFIGYLRSKTILDKFGTGIYPALRRVPFNVRVGTQTAGASASWVGEGKPKPLSKGTFGTTTLDFHKIAVICALTKEEVRFGVSSAEAKVRDDMAAAIAAGIDSAFIDPANAGTASVKPAAITYNVAATAVSGTTPAALRLDLKNMIGTMIAAGIQPNSLVLLMSQGTALSLSLSVNTLGNRDFPDLTKDGGYLYGIPVIVSEAITSLGSPTANMIVAVNAAGRVPGGRRRRDHRRERAGVAADGRRASHAGRHDRYGHVARLALADQHARPAGRA